MSFVSLDTTYGAEAVVRLPHLDHVLRVNRRIERRPAGARLKLRFRAEQRQPACNGIKHSSGTVLHHDQRQGDKMPE